MKEIEVSYQCDQSGWPFVLLTYKRWHKNEQGSEYVIVDDYHHLSAKNARELAAELLEVADKIEKQGGE